MINARNANEVYAILENANSRRIILPKIMETAGVEPDEKVRMLKFKFPKIVDGADLTEMQVCINYINSQGEMGQHIVSDLKPYESDESYVTFSWPFSHMATRYRGLIKFAVCAVKAGEDGEILTQWNTALAQIRVLEGFEVTNGDITPDEDDFIAAQLMAVDVSALEASEKSEEAAEKFDIYSTLTLDGRAADASAAGELSNNIPFVTPEQFGAVGDGVADDSEAIQKMFDAGKLCICPSKTYAIHGVKTGKNVSIIGDGTVFLYNNTSAQITAPEDSYILYNRDTDNGNVNIQGVTFDGNKESVSNPGEYTTIQGSTVVFSNFKEINFRNCVFKNSVMDGAFLTSCGYVNFHDCVFKSNGKRTDGSSGTYNALSVYRDAKKVYIKNCHFSDVYDEAIRADDFELMSVEDCVFTDIGQFILEPIFETVAFCRLNFKNNYVENTGGTCIAIRPHSNTRVDLNITNNTFKKIGAFSQYHSNESNIGILETSSASDGSRGIVWVDNNNISIVSNVCKHVFYLQACLEAYIKNNRIEVSNNPGSRKLISINGTSALTMMNNTFSCEYSEGYSDKSYVLDLYNAKADFIGIFAKNKLYGLKHLAKMPLSSSSVGVVQSIYAEGNIAPDADTLLNISNNTDKINTIKLVGNECAYLAEFARKGTKKFIAIGNDCTDTVKVGRILAGDIYEAANTNTAVVQSDDTAEAGRQQK